MIELVDSIEELVSYSKRDLFSVRVLSLANAYGFVYPFAKFYRQVDDDMTVTAIVSVLDGDTVISHLSDFDNAELSQFFSFCGFSTLLAAELRKQKASESSDIYYGLTDNTKRNELDAEIAEVEEELRKQANKVEIYAQAKNTTYNFMSRRGAGRANASMPYSNTSIYNPGLIHYCCAPADAYISKINVSDKTLVFKSEEVMAIQHTDYADCHLGVIAYVPNDMVKYMESPDDADIIINKDLELKAKLQMVGLRVEEIPKHLQSNFSHDANAVVAVFTLNPNQRVPAWVMSNRLPVRIRVNKIGAMLDPKPLPMYTVPVGKNENVKRSNMISSDTNNHQDKTK